MQHLFLLIIVLSGAYLLHRRAGVVRENRRNDDARVVYRRRIQQDPTNTAAYEALADSLRSSGRLVEARATYQTLIELPGEINNTQIQYKIRQLDMDIELARSSRFFGLHSTKTPLSALREAQFCARCGASNAPHLRRCDNCDAMLHADTFREAFRENWMDLETRKLLFETAIIIAVMLCVYSFFDTLPPLVQGLLIVSTTFVLGWLFLKSIEGNRR